MSHGSHDAWIARQMGRCIGDTGAEPFIDNGDLRSGDDVRLELGKLLRQSDELVVLLTRFSLPRVWVWMEVGLMLLSHKRVVPVMYGVTRKDLARTGADGALANIVERSLNDFEIYLGELRRRVAGDA